MKTFHRFHLSHLCLLALLFTIGTNSPAAAPLPFNPQDGETIVFLGDSITHQSLYPQYLENFFITRYPERRIRFRNAGVGGDAAADALARFEDDVAAHQPDYVTLHLGMNDGRYAEFDTNNLAVYQQGMRKLLDRIEAIGAKPILLSPTMFDHRVTELRAADEDWRFRGKAFSPNYNALMAYFGAWGLDAASRRQAPFVNLWGPLNRHTVTQRRSNPEFTIIWDAIHPNPAGQLIMASEILTQLGVERKAANGIVITKRGKRWVGSKGVTDLTVSENRDEVRFSHKATSLPWVIPVKHSELALKWRLPSDGRTGYQLAFAGHKLSADRLKIAGLAAGTYELAIAGTVIGQWNHVALGTKIEIQENEKTPQYQQALKVAHLNRKRTDDFVRPSRDLAGRIKGIRRRAAAGSAKDVARLPELLKSVSELNQKADVMLEEIYRVAQPVEREWVVRRVSE
jgi:lysophospholipase L1-like esterase